MFKTKFADIITIYEPDKYLRKGYVSLPIDIIEELRNNRWLIYILFKRNFLALYQQSLIGVLWALIIPIFSIGTFIALNYSGIFAVGDIHIPYPIYALLGMASWQLFSTGLIAGINSLVNAGSMITKINFSKKALVIASVGQSIVSFLIQFILAGILFIYFGIAPKSTILLMPILMLPLFLLTLGLSFIFALLNGVLRDIGNMVTVLMTFLMFLTPVLYMKPESGVLAYVTRYNPLYYLVSAPRTLVLYGTFQEWTGFLVASAFSCFVFIVCLIVFHLTETRIAERI